MNPAPKSVTKRRDLAQTMRRRLARYLDLTKDPAPKAAADRSVSWSWDAAHTDARVMDLLWVIALAEQALALETRDQAGDRHATPGRVKARMIAAKVAHQ